MKCRHCNSELHYSHECDERVRPGLHTRPRKMTAAENERLSQLVQQVWGISFKERGNEHCGTAQGDS